MTFIIGTFANSLWNVGRCSLRSMLQVPPSRLRLAWVQTLIQMDPNMDMKWCEYHNVLWFMMTVINDPSMANVLSVPAAKPHLQQSQNYAQMHIDAANNNTSCQVYFEINSVLAPLMAKTPCELEDFLNVSPPACISNWHFSGNRHCNILQHYSLLIASDASAFPNQTWHHRCMTLFDSMLVPLLWLLVLLVDGVGSNLPRSFLHWQRDPVSLQPPTPWNTRTNNKKRHGD